jgi:hypothetical protein
VMQSLILWAYDHYRLKLLEKLSNDSVSKHNWLSARNETISNF